MRFWIAVGIAALYLAALGDGALGPAPIQAAQATDLPDGDGKKILQASCTACHDLTEVTKFKGYYSKDEWRDIVKTMIAYGAVVKDSDIEVLVEYLFKNLGKRSPG